MNRELAREVAFQVRKDEGAHWFQGSWWNPEAGMSAHWEKEELLKMSITALLERRCGTSGCVAGWTVALSYPDAVFDGSAVVTPDGSVRSIRHEAQEQLGLTHNQAQWLFETTRSLDQVVWALENDDPAWSPRDFPGEEG